MACRELGIDIRTRQIWLKDAAEGTVNADGRKDAVRKKPAGALSEEERKRVLEIADSPEYASKAPAQIVATPEMNSAFRWYFDLSGVRETGSVSARRVALQIRANGSNTPRGRLKFAVFSSCAF